MEEIVILNEAEWIEEPCVSSANHKILALLTTTINLYLFSC